MSSFVISDIISCLPATATALHCCQVLTSIHGHIRQKLRPFSKISRPPIKKFVLHDISKHNNNKKQKNIMFVEVFCHFFISALHFWMKHYTNFQNLTKFVSQHLVATHGHFHRHQFLTANYFFIRPDLSYLAVATATWQHCTILEIFCHIHYICVFKLTNSSITHNIIL